MTRTLVVGASGHLGGEVARLASATGLLKTRIRAVSAALSGPASIR